MKLGLWSVSYVRGDGEQTKRKLRARDSSRTPHDPVSYNKHFQKCDSIREYPLILAIAAESIPVSF